MHAMLADVMQQKMQCDVLAVRRQLRNLAKPSQRDPPPACTSSRPFENLRAQRVPVIGNVRCMYMSVTTVTLAGQGGCLEGMSEESHDGRMRARTESERVLERRRVVRWP